jgi:hypothetical protein
MANRYVKKWPTSLIARVTQIKITSQQKEWLLSKRRMITNAVRMWEKGILICCWWECKLWQSLHQVGWRFLKKWNNQLYMQRKWITLSRRQLYSYVYLQHYPKYPTNGNIVKCPSTDEWIKKMWYLHTIEYYSVIKGWHPIISGNMDGSNLGTERQVFHMESKRLIIGSWKWNDQRLMRVGRMWSNGGRLFTGSAAAVGGNVH